MLFYDADFYGDPKPGMKVFVRANGRDRQKAKFGSKVKISTNKRTFFMGRVAGVMGQMIEVTVLAEEPPK